MSNTARLDLLDLDAPLERATVSDGKALLLDPKTIRASRWVNRHETSFQDANFEELRAEIANAGVNVQPIKVRPARDPGAVERYEIVFGHRRHRACLELGLKISVVVEDVDDQVLWSQMERENRSRAPLSAWEQGMMYQRALDAGLFPSLRQLAASISRDVGDVSKAITIANLPGDVVAAFASPHEIRFADAKPLKDAVALAPEAVAATAKELAKGGARPATKVIQALTEAAKGGVGSSNTQASVASQTGSAGGVGSSNSSSSAASGADRAEGVGSSNTAAGAGADGTGGEPVGSSNTPVQHAQADPTRLAKGQAGKAGPATSERRFKAGGQAVVIADDGNGAVVRFAPNALPRERWADLEKALKKLLG